MTQEIRCPKCGRPMVLKTARRGPNAGKRFYGCSGYPHDCRAIVPMEEVASGLSSGGEGAGEEHQSMMDSLFPRTLSARARFHGHQVRFLETAAVPESLMEAIDLEDVAADVVKAFSQWRIDFPIAEPSFTLNQRQRQIIAVLEKILTRGRITLLSPQLESKLVKKAGLIPEGEAAQLLTALVAQGYQRVQSHPLLDSREEIIFYEELLPEILGDNYGQFVVPQVEISSLMPPNANLDTTGYQRVDFAIFHPRLEERIVVEIDGAQHEGQVESDRQRDTALQAHGYTVIRVKTSEIQERDGRQLSVLKAKLSEIEAGGESDTISSHSGIAKFIWAVKIAHQIQIVLLQAIQSMVLDSQDLSAWRVVADLDELGLFDRTASREILEVSVADFVELLANLSRLYSVNLRSRKPTCALFSDDTPSQTANELHISFSDMHCADSPAFHVQNIYFPFHVASTSFPAEPLTEGLGTPKQADLEYFLQYVFRKPHFWEGQYDGVLRALQGKDSLLLLPTGAGKSLVYQLASMLRPGRTVVIDPIISLMEDQIYNLAKMGIDRCIAITSETTTGRDRALANQLFGQGEYPFAYVAPERFQTIEFRDAIRALTVHTPISLIVIDEAHCVSEWGHDFRTAYLNIGRISRAYCRSDRHVPPVLALTGTASRPVLKDVQRELQLTGDLDAIITPDTFDRPELRFRVIHATSQEKIARTEAYLGQVLPSLLNLTSSTLYQTRGKKTCSGLVFCPHVNGAFGVVQVSDEISRDLGIVTKHYSGSAPKGWSTNQHHLYKRRVAREFKQNRMPLLVCTKAFGMGIDKPNIRYTIHFGIPASIESFYQEAGRAGRDRGTAYCCIIASIDDPARARTLLNPSVRVEEIEQAMNDTPREENDDITRALYFHTGAFRGITQERQDIQDVLARLGDIQAKGRRALTIPVGIRDRVRRDADEKRRDVSGQSRQITEKGLHRLLLVGIISDYTINYSKDEFSVTLAGPSKEQVVETYGQYVTGFIGPRKSQVEVEKARSFISDDFEEFVSKMIELLLRFIYGNIESGRRRALEEMMISVQKTSEDEFRQYLNNYLNPHNEFNEKITQAIDEMLAADDVGISKVKEILQDMDSPSEAAQIRGSMARILESYPDQPAFLMLRAVSEAYTRDRNDEMAKQDFMASISSALNNYGLSEDTAYGFASWAVSTIGMHNEALARWLITELLQSDPSRYFARRLVEELPTGLRDIPAWFLLAKLQETCSLLIPNKEE